MDVYQKRLYREKAGYCSDDEVDEDEDEGMGKDGEDQGYQGAKEALRL